MRIKLFNGFVTSRWRSGRRKLTDRGAEGFPVSHPVHLEIVNRSACGYADAFSDFRVTEKVFVRPSMLRTSFDSFSVAQFARILRT